MLISNFLNSSFRSFCFEPILLMPWTPLSTSVLNAIWTVCGCHVVWSWCGQSRVLCVFNSGSAALAFPAWLPWLGATFQVRGQFGVTLGSNVLSNKAAGPQDWVRPVSWQRALPPTPNHGSSRSGGDWDCRTPFSFHQFQFICSYKLAWTN